MSNRDDPHSCPYCDLVFQYHGEVVDHIRERYGFSMVTLGTQLGGAGKTLVARRSIGRSR